MTLVANGTVPHKIREELGRLMTSQLVVTAFLSVGNRKQCLTRDP
jgi:hypothetical protein